MRTVKVFKLVTVLENGEAFSFNEIDPAVRVLYTQDEWAEPVIKGTPLYAFRTEKEARDRAAYSFGCVNCRTQLWEAEADFAKPYNHRLFEQSQYERQPGWLERWKNWRRRARKDAEPFLGMVLCGKIKITRRIK